MGIIRITDRIWKRFRSWVSGGPPSAPTTLTATVLSETQIKLDWDDVGGELGYKLEAKTSTSDWVAIGEVEYFPLYSVPADTVTYTASCIAGYTWQFRICATNAKGDSDWLESDEVTSYVNPPTSVTATQYTASIANIAWTDTSSVETGFEIQRSANGAAFANLANVAANVTTYQDTTISVGTSYIYKVSAIADGADSNFSANSSTLTPTYLYGYPAAQAAEPNVVAQWLFDEASGNVVDEVTSISLPPVTAANTFTYNTAATGVWAGVSPGIAFGGGTTYARFGNDTEKTQLAPGTSDFVVEHVAKLDSDASTGYTVIEEIFNGTTGWQWYVQYSSTTNWWFFLAADDGSYEGGATAKSSIRDGVIHKHRIYCDRDGVMEYFIDGISQGTHDITSLATKNVSAKRHYIGAVRNGSYPFKGTIYEMRLTVGNKTNNSGGPGGG